MKCKKCGFEWMDNEKFSNLTKCLFCGEDLFPKKELSKEPTMAEVLVYIKENYGEEVFKEGSKLLGMFGDLAPKLKSEYRILDIAVRNHIERYFAGVKESDIEISINKFKNDFGDFMNEKTLNILTEAFMKVFHQNYNMKKPIEDILKKVDKLYADKKYEEAFNLLKISDLENANVQVRLAYMYGMGTGVEKNKIKSAELYNKAAIQGNVKAMFNLANMYMNGDGISKNHEKAISLYKIAAEHGNEQAKKMLEKIYKF